MYSIMCLLLCCIKCKSNEKNLAHGSNNIYSIIVNVKSVMGFIFYVKCNMTIKNEL